MSLVTPRKGYKSIKWYFGKHIEIPLEWEVVKFRTKIKMEYGSGLTEDKRDNLKNPVYGSGGLIGFHSKPNVKGPGIIVARKGSLGNVFFEKDDFFPIDTVYYITEKETGLNLRFLFYYLLHMKLENLRIVTSKPGISREDVYSYRILSIPLLEQEKIASILSNVDSLIESTGQVIETSKRVKTGLMQKLLTRGIGHTKFKKVNFGGQIKISIPEEWIVSTLESISKNGTQNGLAISTFDYGVGIPIVGMTKFYASEILSNNNMKEVAINEKTKKLFSLKSFDLLFGRRSMDGKPTGEAGKCIIVSDIFTPIIFESSVIRMSIKHEHNPFFIYHLFKSGLGKRIRVRIIRVSAVSGISSGDLKKLKIPLPPKSEQDRIVSILSNIDSKITSQEQYKEKLEKLKKSLMQKLLTGEVRV